MISEEEIESILAGASDPQSACEHLVAAANEVVAADARDKS